MPSLKILKKEHKGAEFAHGFRARVTISGKNFMPNCDGVLLLSKEH